MQQPDISYVIATYRRPDVLRATLRALCLQRGNWEGVVVGDCCDDTTLDVIRAIDDQRIRYYNLPARFGEQAGPNSVGMTVTRGQWLAFLNHDDLLLPDHTQRILDIASTGNVDVVSTRFVSINDLNEIGPAHIEAKFGAVLPKARSTRQVMASPLFTLEPASAWAIRREVALAVGPWRTWESVHRVPWHDWMIRVLTKRTRWHFDPTVTGLCVQTHHLAQTGLYDEPAHTHEKLLDAITSIPIEDLRELIKTSGALDAVPPQTENLLRRVEQRLGLSLLRATKLDYVAGVRTLRQRDPSSSAAKVLLRRTGENIVNKHRLPEYLADPEALRVR